MGQLTHNISLTQPELSFPNGGAPPSLSSVQNNVQSDLPDLQKPSFQQAAKEGATPGGVNALSPGLSKAGKLVTLLTSGLQGALAGRAAQEQMIAQTGGRRAGGVGTGFEAGYTLPWQRAQQQAQASLAQMGAQPINTEFGQVPAAYLPKFIAPMMRLQGTEETNQTRENVAGQNNQTKQNIATQTNDVRTTQGGLNRQNRLDVAGMNLGPMAAVPPDLQRQFGLPGQLPLRMLNQAESAANRPLTLANGENGPAVVNKETGQSKNLGLGSPRMGGVTQIADPNNAGQSLIVRTPQAIGQAGTQSASLQVPKAAAKAEVPTNIGNQKVAFNTMINHAELLRKAARALNNGDVRALNGLSNRAMSEFGDPALTNFDAIANAYNHEVTTVISKGHVTDSEVAKGGATMPSNANYATIDQVLNSYEALAKSKMNNLNQQKQSAVNQSQPKSRQTQRFTDNGVTYNIPAAMVNDFKKDHPNAR